MYRKKVYAKKRKIKQKKYTFRHGLFVTIATSEECMEDYQNILYKKKAVENLASILGQTEAKKIFFVAGKTAYQNFGVQITNQLALADCEFVLKLLPSKCTQQVVSEGLDGAKDCDFVVALGGGSICDIAKIVATKLDLPLVIVPSVPSTIAYFSNVAYCQIEKVYKKIYTSQAYKILVDENIICKANRLQVINGQKFALSLYETLFSCQFDNLFYNSKKDISVLKMQLCKLKDNYEYLQSDTDDSKLVLMDILIELAKALEDLDSINVFDFAFCLREKSDLPFGTLCLLSSKILANLYKQIFNFKHIYKFSLPNFDIIDKNLCSLKINKSNVDFKPINKMINSAAYTKINSIKNQCLTLCESFEEQINNFLLPADKSSLKTDIVCKALNVVPVLYNCSSILNMIYGMGILNLA